MTEAASRVMATATATGTAAAVGALQLGRSVADTSAFGRLELLGRARRHDE